MLKSSLYTAGQGEGLHLRCQSGGLSSVQGIEHVLNSIFGVSCL